MKKNHLLLRFAVLVAAMMCALGASAAKAYACYTLSDSTLTFYFDDQYFSRPGAKYELETNTAQPGWCEDGTREYVTRVVFDPSFADARPVEINSWFYGMSNLLSINGMEYLNTSNVINMAFMFTYCHRLTSLDLSNFNTANVYNMSAMFSECNSLTSLDVSSFNTVNVEYMASMFSHCSGLTGLDVSSFNTSNVTDMHNMFAECSGLTSIDVSSFNTTKVTSMSNMFIDCSGLTSLDLSNFNTANVKEMSWMFYGCRSLTTIYAGSGWSTAAVTSSANMFWNCTSLVGGQGTTFDASHIDKTYARIDGGPSNPGYFTEKKEAYACYTPSNTTLTFYYDSQRYSRTGTTYNLNADDINPGWRSDGTNTSVTRVVFDPSFAVARPTTTYRWFNNMTGLTTISGLHYLNTSEVTNMQNMFSGSGLTSLDLSGFNTANVTDMSYMFYNCSNLRSLDVSSFNTSNVTDMRTMFYGCSNLTSLDVSSFNTSSATTLTYMFCGCSSLTSLDVSCFNTSSAKNLSYMFRDCSGLTSLDLGSFNTSRATNMSYMFYGCSGLNTIYAGDGWNTAAVTSSANMFWNCSNIRGGKGTTYDANHIDKAYAHIDGGPSNPGYFTEKPKEAYACYTSDNTTLTFYYDDQRTSRTGTTYSLNNGDAYPDWYNDHTCQSVTRVVFDPSFADARPTSTYNWFARMQNLTGITGMKSYLNTSAVTNMSYMFYYCTNLKSIDVSGFNTANVTNLNCMFFYCHELTYLDLRNFNTANVTNMQSMFAGCNKMSSLNLSTFNTANVTDMDYVFQGCTELSNLNMKNINTSNVTSMTGMFWNCSSLTSLDLSSFNTSGVVYMGNMFRGCSELTTVYVGDGWNTSAVDFSSMMFLDCLKIKGSQGTTYDANYTNKAYARIDGGTARPGYLSEVKVSYAVYTPDNTTLTFYYDGQRDSRPGTTYDLPSGTNDAGWYTDGSYESVTQVVFDSSFVDARPKSAFCWFSGMRSLYAVSGMEYLNTSQITDMYAMFYSCSSLTSLDLSHFNTTNVTDMRYMFSNCINLTTLNLGSFNTAKVMRITSMFFNCSALTTIYAGGGWSMAAVNESENMFKNCGNIRGGQGTTYDANHTNAEYAHIDGGPSNPGYFSGHKEAYLCFTADNRTMTFYYDDQINNRPGTIYHLNTAGDLPEWYDQLLDNKCTKAVFDPSFADARPTSTKAWFYRIAVGSITGMEYLNTSEVTDMSYMFTGISLESLDVSHFNTTKVTNMSNMFHGSEFLTSLDLGSFNTSNVTDMNSMFTYCQSLTNLDLSNFNTANVTNMNDMFNHCYGLTSVDLSSFNTANVTDMGYMFYDCRSLTSLDLSNFNTSSVTEMSGMFDSCFSLETIYVGDGWSTAAVTSSSNMFDVCYSLVGGKGTAYSSSNPKDKTYAHIDGGTSNPGYFSEKGGTFLRGDVNGDGSVNISDVTALINYLLSHNATGLNLQNANCNQDSTINISDVTALINYLLSGSW